MVLNKRAARLFIFDNFSYLHLLLSTYTFINFHKIFYLHKLFILFKGIFWFFFAGALGCAGALNISFPKSIWFLALCSHSGPKYLYLAMKTSYLHVYLVPTRLLIFRKNSHLHVYLVYTFIQYHGVILQGVQRLKFMFQVAVTE